MPVMDLRALRLSGLAIVFTFVAWSQSGSTGKFGGLYDRLLPEQKLLVNAWAAEFENVTGTRMEPKSGYDGLPLSTRTTFEAVTHALSRSPLTAEDGTSLGTALSLIELVEGANGQIPGVRGDQQFRVYVLLKPDALDRLYQSREYKRVGDNTVYHIGYPINFRQQGGAPSIQVSVTRTGRRADIDVDYRSSSKATALFNGHLTAANSDVRAGGNYQKHIGRWEGFSNWWQDLMGLFKEPQSEPEALALKVEIPEQPRVSDSAPVTEAVLDFYKTWFVDQKPEQAVAYFSVRSYACLTEFRTGESVDSGLARLRILQHMRQALAAYGASDNLSDFIQGISLYSAGSKPVRHDNGALFGLEELTPQTARELDCRTRLKLKLAEEIPDSGPGSGQYFATVVRFKREVGFLTSTQIWSREQGHWKIVTWYFEHPSRPSVSPKVAEPEQSPALPLSSASVDPGIIAASEKFHRLWLIDRKYNLAAAYFASASSGCDVIQEQKNISGFLSTVGNALPRAATKLTDVIETVPHGHPHMQEAPHPAAQAFLLARVSDDLGAMGKCGSAAPPRSATAGTPEFKNGYYQTAFRIKGVPGVAKALVLEWEKSKGGWKVVGVQIPD
jgi:hypothetical protein